MRRVACYSARSELEDGEERAQALEQLDEIVRTWLATKGWPGGDQAVTEITLPGGRSATLIRETATSPDGRLFDYTLEEPTEQGRFSTRVVVGGRGKELRLFVELRAGGESLHVKPVLIDARCPEVYRQLLDCREWFTGATIVRTKPIPFLGPRGASALVRILKHPDRNLPLVAVSTTGSEAFVRDLPDGLARDLAGVALVAVLDETAAWGITQELGKEWSCYNRAVRLYWPMKGQPDRAFSHPLWTAERLIDSAETASAAAARLRNQLRRQLLALSTYTISEPALLLQIRQAASEQRLAALREQAEDSGEWQALAEAYAEENKAYKATVEKLQAENERLEDQVASLSVAFRYRETPEDEPDILPETEPNVETVADAVEAARGLFMEELVFGQDVPKGVSTLAADAGPPEKIFEYFRTLAEMVRMRREGGLGVDMLIWLSQRGAKATDESETVLKSNAEMRKRTWHDGQGDRAFSKHFKPSDGTSPDRCVRIYFDYDESVNKAVIGWVGRHL